MEIKQIRTREYLKLHQIKTLDSFVRGRRLPSPAIKLDFEGEGGSGQTMHL